MYYVEASSVSEIKKSMSELGKGRRRGNIMYGAVSLTALYSILKTLQVLTI